MGVFNYDNGVAQGASPVFEVSRLMGVYPFIKGKISFPLLFISATFHMTYFSLYVYSWKKERSLQIFNDKFTEFIFRLYDYYSSLTLAIVALTFVILYLKHGYKEMIIKKFNFVDSCLLKIGMRFTYKRNYYLNFICKVVFLAIYFIISFCRRQVDKYWETYSNFHVSLFLITSTMGPVYFNLIVWQMNVFLHYVRERLVDLRVNLVNVWENGGYEGRKEKVEVMLLVENMICDIAEMICDEFKWAMVLMIPTLFLNLTFSLVVLSWKISRAGENSWLHASTTFLILLLWMWNLSDMTDKTQKVQNEANEFSRQVYIHYVNDPSGEFIHNEIVQLHLIRKRKIHFTVEFFSLDNTLVHSMVAGAFTYMIIFIQMDPSYFD